MFYRIYPSQDTTITNATLTTPNITGTISNFGASTELFLFANPPTNSNYNLDPVGISRALIKFPLTDLSGKIFQDLTVPSRKY